MQRITVMKAAAESVLTRARWCGRLTFSDVAIERRATRVAVMEVERGLGFEAADREFEHLGCDIESGDLKTGEVRACTTWGDRSGRRPTRG